VISVGQGAVLFFKLGSAFATPLTEAEFTITVPAGTLPFIVTVTWIPTPVGFPLVQALSAPTLQVTTLPLIAQGDFGVTVQLGVPLKVQEPVAKVALTAVA